MPYDFRGCWVEPAQLQQQVREILIRQSRGVLLAGKPDRVSIEDPRQLIGPRRRILVIRNMGLGDVLLTTPLLRALRQKLSIRVDFLTEAQYVPLLAGNRHVNRVAAIGHPEGLAWADQADAVIDLREYAEHPLRQEQNRARAFLEAAGFRATDTDADLQIDYTITPEEAHWARVETLRLFDARGERPGTLVAYVWRASTGQRSWCGATHARMLAALSEAGYSVLVLDAEAVPGLADTPLPLRIVDATGRYQIRQTAALIGNCAAVVTPDTGLFHLAQALRIPALAYFGAFPLEDRATSPASVIELNQVRRGEPPPCGFGQSNAAFCPVYPCRGYSCGWQDNFGQSACLHVTPERLLTLMGAVTKGATPGATPTATRTR